MRILMLARYLPAEGSTTHMYTLAEGLIKRGHQVAIASAGHDGSEAAERIFESVQSAGVVHLKMPFQLKPGFSRTGKMVQAFIYIAGVPLSLYQIARWKPDVIHVHYPVTSFLARLYRYFAKVKFVVTYHISGIPMHPLHMKGDNAIAISEDLKEEIIRRFTYSPEAVQLVHNGIELSRFTEIDKSKKNSNLIHLGLESASSKIIVGFVGTLGLRKGLDLLLESFRRLDKEKFHLVVVGDGETEWLQDLTTDYQLSDSVSVFPFSEPEIFYSIFDVFVLPSRKEGFGLVSIEAMASGVLTIRSNVEGARDQITDGVTGFLFDNEDTARLTMLLQKISEGVYDTDAIASAGREKVIQSFSVDQMVDKTEEIYRDLMG